LSDIADVRANLAQCSADYCIDISRSAIWALSAGMPFGLYHGLNDATGQIRCIVGYYGFGDFDALLKCVPSPSETLSDAFRIAASSSSFAFPLLLVRAGKDNEILNESFDLLVARAHAQNIPVEVYSHPEGHHAFDVLDDNDRSRYILENTFRFLAHLLGKDNCK
ncbi:MAG TPA: dienelactone hydrolase family protein, partial [Spirochaetota bacterium]